MNMHKLLEKQIKKHLSEDCLQQPKFQRFIQVVNESYHAFDRDKELMDHAFSQSEEEYREVYQNLEKEYQLKQKSIHTLYASLRELDGHLKISPSENLEEISDLVAQLIHKRKESEHHLKVQEEKYRNIIANINLGLWETDNSGRIVFSNQSFCEASQYSMDEILGKKTSELVFSRKNAGALFRKSKNARTETSRLLQVPVKTKFGAQRWWVVSKTANYDDQGRKTGTIGIQLDITDQKRLEEDLKKQKEKAQEASRAKEAFLSNMSHEIRTPLNAIIGFIRELQKQELSAAQRQYIENCSNASQHLLSIINNVLDISKIEAGEMPLEIKAFSLKESVQSVMSILKSKADQKKIAFTSSFAEDMAPVFRGDSVKIEQILFNLLGNSLKFTSHGEIKVDCEILKDNPKSQRVKITVADTGIGMSQEFIHHIFKKFYQEDETIARKFGGTGLGMAITQELVKLLKGNISIASTKNQGTQIEVILTLKKGTSESQNSQKNALPHRSLKGKKILLVEDNELNRMVAQHTLKNFECQTTEVENGKEALNILKHEEFDIILMDIQMPELDGIETTKILKSNRYFTTPIIALSANAFKSEIEKCRAAGMTDYIPKPFTEEKLLETLQRHLYPEQMQKTEHPKDRQTSYSTASLYALGGHDMAFLHKMLSIFIDQTETVIPQIEQMFEAENYAEISRLIHKIKPSIEGLQINSIIPEVKALELKAKTAEPLPEELWALFRKIRKELENVIALIQEKEFA